MAAMTNQSPFGPRGRLIPSIPKGDILASFDTYPEAQKAVDRLAHADIDVSKISVVGSDLKTVERVTGRLSYGRVSAAGAASGAWFGLFFGLLLTFFLSSANALLYAIAAVVIGAGFGILFGIVSYALTKRTRDYTSTHQVIASRYEIIVDPSITLRAQEAMARTDQQG